MITKLNGTLKREVMVGKDLYTVTLSPDGFVLAPKGRRKGVAISWSDLVNGEAALATALNASLGMFPVASEEASPPTPKAKR